MSIETVKLFVINFEDSTTLADLALLFMDSGEVVAIRMKQGEKRKYALVEMLPEWGRACNRRFGRKELAGDEAASDGITILIPAFPTLFHYRIVLPSCRRQPSCRANVTVRRYSKC
jgi:hypothetical protein